MKKAETQTEPKKYTFKAKPNWEDADIMDVLSDDNPDKFRIPPDMIPEGFTLQWIRESYFGQPDPQNVSQFHRGGWTPVHQEDFDGRFNGMFMPKNQEGQIAIGGMVLVYRPIEFTEKARSMEKRRAREQLEIKERDLRGGNLPNVTLDTQHKSALNSNKIGRTFERITVPKDEGEAL